LTASNVSASGFISASNLWVQTSIVDGGTLTVLGNTVLGDAVSDTIQITGSTSLSGSLNVVGNTTLQNTFATNLTASNVSASGFISASSLRVETSIVDGGTLTVLGNSILGDTVSDTTQITGSTSLSGSLSVVGNTTLQNTFATNLTASNVSASNTLSASNVWFGNSMTYVETMATGSITTPDITFTSTATTGSDVMFKIDTTALTGSAVALQINASGSQASYAISASNGIIAGTNYIATNITASNISASGNISASTLRVETSIVDGGTLTVLGNSILGDAVTDTTQITGSTSISGSLSVVGSSTLQNIFATNLTASNISASGVITSSGLYIMHPSIGIIGSADAAFDLLKTGVQTLNFALDGTAIVIGSASGYTLIQNQLIAPNISSSASIIGSSITASNISASGLISASSLTITGNSRLQDVFLTNLTASNISSSRITGSLFGTSSWANISISSSVDKINDSNAYYVTFVNNTGSVSLKADADVLSYNPLLNRVTVGNTSGSLYISNDNGTNPNSIALFNSNDNQGAIIQIGQPSSNATASLYVGNQSNGFRVLTGQGANTGVYTELTTAITNATNAAGYTDANAALRVDGGARISKDTWISGSLNVAGDFTVFGSSSVVYISSSTVIINDNIIQLNAFVPYERYAGFEVYDSGSNQRSASLLWDGDQDNWMTVDQNNSSSNIIIGPTASFGNAIPSLTVNRIPKAYDGNAITNSLISDDGTTLSYTGLTISSSKLLSTTSSANYISASTITAITGSITYITGALVTYVTGSFTTLTITTGSSPGVGSQVPSSPTAAGMPGQINVDNNFIYVYTNNIWKRVPISNWSA
jgi:hypothetical protein